MRLSKYTMRRLFSPYNASLVQLIQCVAYSKYVINASLCIKILKSFLYKTANNLAVLCYPSVTNIFSLPPLQIAKHFCEAGKLFNKKTLLNSRVLAEKQGFEPWLRFTRTTPLAGEPLRPLGYFSIAEYADF